MDHKKLLNANLILQLIFGFGFMISSFVVAGTANYGFNAVLTVLMLVGYLGYGLTVINKRQSEINVGILLGSSMLFTWISLATAIFWGQLSGCNESFDGKIDHYSCSNVSGMRAVSAFAVFLFLLQLAFSVTLYMWRDSILGEASSYQDMGGQDQTTGSSPYASYEPSSSYNQKPNSSADL